MRASLSEHAHAGGHLALLFHPFAIGLAGEPGWTALDEVLDTALELSKEGLVELLRMDETANWMIERRGDFGYSPQLDDSTWMASSG